MALDHYVSQVHLKQFTSPDRTGHLRAIRKSDLKIFPCRPQDVCRTDEGNTNAYLTDPRAVEEFLKGVEPNYNRALDNMRNGTMTPEDVGVIAGFLSYTSCCTPTAIRTQATAIQGVMESSARILDAQGIFGRAPDSLGNKTLSELLDSKEAEVDINPKYPQAIGITTIMGRTSLFGNSPWEIIRNELATTSPFVTSDFPASLEPSNDPRVMNRVVPLAPDLAVRIWPDIELSRAPVDLTFAKHRQIVRKANFQTVSSLNQTIVRNAEDLVFYGPELTWIPGFVKRNKDYRVKSINQEIPWKNGVLNLNRVRVKKD